MHQRAKKTPKTTAAESSSTVIPATPAPFAHTVPVITLLPIADVIESPLNPRRRMDDAKLQELTDSIRMLGVRVAIEVRPSPFEDGKFEIIAGARRRRAAERAGLTQVPCTITPCTDQQLLEMAIHENEKREGIHPIDLAATMKRLMEMDPAQTLEVLVTRHGHTVTYWRDKLHLLALIPDAREAFEADVLTEKHAVIIARLSIDEQARALVAAFGGTLVEEAAEHLIAERAWDKLRPALLSTRDLQGWVSTHAKANLQAPEEQARLLEQMTDHEREEAETHPFVPASLLQLSTKGGRDLTAKEARDMQLLRQDDWVRIERTRDQCDSVKRAIVVHGGPTELVDACYDKTCAKHFPPQVKKAEPKPASKARGKEKTYEELEAERLAALKKWEAEAPAYMRAVGAIVAKKPFDYASFLRGWMGTVAVKSIEQNYGLKFTAATAPLFHALHRVSKNGKKFFLEDVRTCLKVSQSALDGELAKAAKKAPAKPTKRAKVPTKRSSKGKPRR